MTSVIEPVERPTVRVRPARPDDGAALTAMFQRCSKWTRYRRFHGFVSRIPAKYLRQCLAGDRKGQRALVAEPAPGAATPSLVALASATPVADSPRVWEMAALVEDEWQCRGVGRTLVEGLFAEAWAARVELIRLQLCREQPSLLTYVVTHLPVMSTFTAGCDITVDLAVPAPGTEPFRSRRSPAAETAP